jgi:hypothetical protein
MSDQPTRIAALLNHGDRVPDAAVYVDGRLLKPDSGGSTAFDLTPAGVALPARTGAPPGTTVPARSDARPGSLPGTGPRHQQHSGSQPAPAGPAEHIKGLGKHGARVDVTDPGGKQHVPYTVHKNKDGSLDVSIPKGPGHPHATRIHVAPGKHVKLNLSQDKNGHVKVHTGPASPSPKPPATSQPKVPGQPAGPKTPAMPAMPSAGGAPPGGGGGAPPGGGGGAPPGGGGMPTAPAPTGPAPVAPGGGNQTKNADRTVIRQLGDQIAAQPGKKLGDASGDTKKIAVGFPGFGVLGAPLSQTHDSARNDAAQYLSQGQDQLINWRTALHQVASNWGNADGSSTVQTN